jgi:hypothetical protein
MSIQARARPGRAGGRESERRMKITAVVPFVVDPGYGKNFLITEHFVNFEPRGREVAVSPFRVEGGYITRPTAPGAEGP